MRTLVRSLLTAPMAALLALAPSFAAEPAPPTLRVSREPGRIVIQFEGILMAAESLLGPWTEIPGAVSPLALELSSAPYRFFQARHPTAPAGVFASRTPAHWTLTGAFQDHFELAHAGMPDGIFPPVREKPYFTGSVVVDGLTVPASLRVRGNSSLQECPFPKLKLKIARDDRTNTPFAEARELKIGSHCAEGGRGPIGRLRDETATYREALAYEVAETLGFTIPRVRRAVLTYLDTSTPGPDSPTGWQLQRQALLIEDPEVLGERLGGRALSDEEIEALNHANFPPTLILDLHLLHALLGNWDYALSTTGEELWNTDVIQLENGLLIPLPGDFDLASWVTGEVRLNAPHDYRPELPDLEREMRFRIGQLREQFPADLFAASVVRFTLARSAVEAQVQSMEVDAEGRLNAQLHLGAFYAILAETRP
ncbi:MAG: hypothetical protein IT580_00120 [Verrucomicrobiales bacterium]|nr:hypothetical protein [Verrucomicrobiales bacterium]